MTYSFPKALETAAPSDRGVSTPSVPVAPIVLSSQDDMRTVVRVSYFSQALATVRYRQGHAGILNWFRALPGRSFRALHHALQKLCCALAFPFRQFPLRWFGHVDEHEPERLKCRANALKDFTK